ncbi:hypothetical protein Tco_1182308 [Tanacetum coccineum]
MADNRTMTQLLQAPTEGNKAVDEPVFPPEETEPVIPPPSTDITIGARITVRLLHLVRVSNRKTKTPPLIFIRTYKHSIQVYKGGLHEQGWAFTKYDGLGVEDYSLSNHVFCDICLLPTLLFTPTLSPAEPSGEPMMRRAYIPEYIPLEDEHEFSAEEQPILPVDSPTAESPGYVTESDPEEDPEEDDANDEDEDDEDEEEEEEEHLAPVDSTIVVPVDEPVFPPKGTEPVIPPPSTDLTIGLGYHRSGFHIPPTRGRDTADYPLHHLYTYPSPVDRRDDILESEQPPRKRLYLSTLGSRYEVGESSTARPTRGRGIDYGFVITVDAEERVTELAELHERDTQDLYALLEDAQDRDSMDGGGGGICFPRGLGSLNRIESGSSETAIAAKYSYSDTTLDIRREMSDMQAELLALREQQRRARQPGQEVRIPDHQDASGDADSHI